jgi:hypothetical protein
MLIINYILKRYLEAIYLNVILNLETSNLVLNLWLKPYPEALILYLRNKH